MADRLIPDYRRKGKLIQPNLIRSRAPYRAPINSEMLNLESEQIRYDLSMLRSQLDSVQLMLEDDLRLVLEGATSTGGNTFPATPTTRIADVLAVIMAKVDKYDKRIRELEILKGLR